MFLAEIAKKKRTSSAPKLDVPYKKNWVYLKEAGIVKCVLHARYTKLISVTADTQSVMTQSVTQCCPLCRTNSFPFVLKYFKSQPGLKFNENITKSLRLRATSNMIEIRCLC